MSLTVPQILSRAALAAALFVSTVRAQTPATMPTTNPAADLAALNAAAAEATPATAPAAAEAVALKTSGAGEGPAATQPTTQPAATTKPKFPTPGELWAKIKATDDAEKAKTLVAWIDLSGAFVEKPADFSLLGGNDAATFRQLLNRLRAAREDGACRAVLLTFGTGTSLNLSQALEVRRELENLRKASKRTFVYADTYEMKDYVLASAATDVCLMEGGELFMPGIGLEAMFYKGAFDKLGVKADYVQIGEYKGAEEPYTRTEPSPELRGELEKLTGALYDEIVRNVSLSRGIGGEQVKRAIDETMVPARAALERGMVDHLVDLNGVRDLLAGQFDNDVRIEADYGEAEKKQLDFANPFALIASLTKREPEKTGPKIAVVYAEGVIVDGSGEGGLFGEGGVGSDRIREAMRAAGRDDDVRAVVLRIDSPGGSALASEAMWQSVRRVADEKPVVVSIGGMAASGGYYLAVAGDKIYAEPTSIVGSIGVVGGKFVLSGLYDKLGLTTASFEKGKNADLFSSDEAFSEPQKRLVRNWMKNTYDQFTERVTRGRQGKVKDVDQIARGRIFLARQGLDLGMVDALGGLNDAIADAAGRADLEPGKYDVTVLPAPQTFADLIGGGGGKDVRAADLIGGTGIDPLRAVLSLVPSDKRALVVRQLQVGELLGKRPVVLMAPFVVKE